MKSQDIIDKIFDLRDEDVENWVNERIETLEQTSTETMQKLNPFAAKVKRNDLKDDITANTEINGFLTKNVEISKDFYSTGFVLDDTSFYKMIVQHIKNSDKNLISNNTYIMHLIQRTINDYFGVTATQQRRLSVYNSSVSIDEDGLPSDKPFSVKKFKQNNSGCCSERSAVAQNILSFLGYDTSMIYGYVLSEHSGKNEAHVYNCISLPNGNGVLIDFTNPIFRNGRYYRPSIHKVDSEKLKKFTRGNGEIEVFHKTIRTVNGKDEEELEAWVYGSSEIEKEYFEKKKYIENPDTTVITTADVGKKSIDASMDKKLAAAKVEVAPKENEKKYRK